MPKITTLASIQVEPTGALRLRVEKGISERGRVILSEPHIHRIEVDLAIKEGLVEMQRCLKLEKWPMISAEEIATVEAHGKLARRLKGLK